MSTLLNPTAQQVANRLSLRPPQREALLALTQALEDLPLKKLPADNDALLQQELGLRKALVQQRFPHSFRDFERDFVSLCFALATGVGKTRLMGAFIAYLYRAHGIRNFFILAPNLTIYEKLKQDFGNLNHPKYVFRGIAEFSSLPPYIVTGDNYENFSVPRLLDNTATIHLFNIGKINQTEKSAQGKSLKTKKFSEILGASYFSFLQSLPDLVLLMDESHRYRGKSGWEVLNELRPVLGLEVTATPQVQSGSKATKFKNVVYEYSLAKAIRDGFVKEPAVATRENLDPKTQSKDALQRLKLEDGIRLHEETKVQLELYHLNTGKPRVKPFVLVVARDIGHAAEVKQFMESPGFFRGAYAGKVIEVNSKQSGEEAEENITKLLEVEDPKNPIEVVIHVHMLKEGWDVTNLYTIIPLNAAGSQTLVEQTLGRGLRLPYGQLTGQLACDRLTVVAHDRFQSIVEEANKPGSLIRQENIILLDHTDLDQDKEVLISGNTTEMELEKENQKIQQLPEGELRARAQFELEVKRVAQEIIPNLNKDVDSVAQLTRPEVKDKAVTLYKERIQANPQQNLFAAQAIETFERNWEAYVEEAIRHIIEIPRVTVQLQPVSTIRLLPFTLDLNSFRFVPGEATILVQSLTLEGQQERIAATGVKVRTESAESQILSELIFKSEIDYDSMGPVLKDLVLQLTAFYRSYIGAEEEVLRLVSDRKKDIANLLYAQIRKHAVKDFQFREAEILPFQRIEQHNFTKYKADDIRGFEETISPTADIPKYVFGGFKKACHTLYKFESKTEKDLSILLERDPDRVVKWMRPAEKQFTIYHSSGSSRYHPDFVVETQDTIWMVETKKAMDIPSESVQAKAMAAMKYCEMATRFNAQFGKKPWKYLLIPHNAVQLNMSWGFIEKQFEFGNT